MRTRCRFNADLTSKTDSNVSSYAAIAVKDGCLFHQLYNAAQKS